LVGSHEIIHNRMAGSEKKMEKKTLIPTIMVHAVLE
jgi:hypothetical protein